MTLHTAFGLEIESELSLPWLLPGSGRPSDVSIRYGSVPTALTDPLGDGGYFQANRDVFLFKVRDVARYLVVKGREIWIDRVPDCSEDLLRTYLLGSIFGAMMHQRRLLVMHASSIRTARGAVLFVGPRGHGKSTLLAALIRRGHPMLADDVTAIDVETPSAPLAFSSFPRMRLSADSAAQLGLQVGSCPRIPSSNKFLVPVDRFCSEPQPVHAVYALDIHEAPDIRLEPVDSLQRFAIVGKNTYRTNFLQALGLRQMHFQAAANVAKAVQMRRITRPASPFLLDELVDRLEAEFGPPVTTTQEQEAS